MIAVGVDVGKTLLEVAIHGEVKLQRLDNTPAGIRQLMGLLKERGAQRIVVEATGGYPATSPSGTWALGHVRRAVRRR